MIRRAILLAVVVVSSACSIFGDFGQYSTDDAPAANDAAAEAAPAGDAASDGAAFDADADAARFCVPDAHTFCADFDGDDLAQWTEKKVDPGGVLEITTTQP